MWPRFWVSNGGELKGILRELEGRWRHPVECRVVDQGPDGNRQYEFRKREARWITLRDMA